MRSLLHKRAPHLAEGAVEPDPPTGDPNVGSHEVATPAAQQWPNGQWVCGGDVGRLYQSEKDLCDAGCSTHYGAKDVGKSKIWGQYNCSDFNIEGDYSILNR